MAKMEILKGRMVDGSDTNDKTKASTLITAGRLVGKDGNGDVIHSLTSTKLLGIALETKAAADTTEAPIQIAYISQDTELLAEVDAGTPADTHEGDLVDLHANGGVDLTASTNDDFIVVRYLPNDSTHVVVKPNHNTVY